MISNILKNFQHKLEEASFFMQELNGFDLKGFEERLMSEALALYNDLSECILSLFCQSSYFKEKCDEERDKVGGTKMRRKSFKLTLQTGFRVGLTGYYIGKVKDKLGKRQLFHRLSDTVGSDSPSFASHVGKLSVMPPSFGLATDLLSECGITCTSGHARSLSLALGSGSLQDRVSLQLAAGENLTGKIVAVLIGGGRSRTREYTGEFNPERTHRRFNTPWREPELLVIQVLDPKTGLKSKQEYPIYDCTYGDDQCFELLKKYLKALKVNQAAHVQFVADGAPWIWNRVSGLIKELEISPKKVTQTLDYYHAVEHLGGLIEHLPKQIDLAQRAQLRTQLKEKLWNGEIESILDITGQLVKRAKNELKREMEYFRKHKHRCRFRLFREQKLLCGSGIVESAIRRVINLRFKCPSSFWKLENLEPMNYLRAVAVSGRWEIMWNNRTN